MVEVEKLQDVPVSVTPVGGTDTKILRLRIPASVANKLNIRPTKVSGQKIGLYITPPVDQIKDGGPFELRYKFPGSDDGKTNDSKTEEDDAE